MSSSSALELSAPAKLNLVLEVLGRRPDGYHEIDTILTEIDLCDRVSLERADGIELEVTGEPAPADATNLAWRAAEALGVGARIRLHKRIPAGAGLGGGSSDAAAVLKGLDRLYGLETPPGRLLELATGLGADVPFFLTGGLARCGGIGERVEPLPPLGEKRFILAVPDLPLATKAVYRAFDPVLTGNRETASLFVKRHLGGSGPTRAVCFNRLQGVAEGLEPRLSAVREHLEARFGAPFTLTGSGSAYFAAIDVDACPETASAGGVSARLFRVGNR